MKNQSCCNQRLNIAGRQIVVYPSIVPDAPIVYLNTLRDESGNVYEALYKDNCPDFTLVVIKGLVWNHDMAPWDIPPISKSDTPCTGGADVYLKLLTEQIVPLAEAQVKGQIVWRGLVGYSLAGLFAVYLVYHTNLFSRIASISGSLWFLGFREYVFSHEMKGRLEYMYFALGDKECQTRNPYLKSVKENTEKIEEFYRNKGIDTMFQLNPGSHFKKAVERTAMGIS